MSAGLIDATEFAYLTGSLSFPRTMIDKITPYPNAQVATVLRQDGLEDTKPVVTQKGSTISYFVNTEQPQYLVIEDKFPNGRPALDQIGRYLHHRRHCRKVHVHEGVHLSEPDGHRHGRLRLPARL